MAYEIKIFSPEKIIELLNEPDNLIINKKTSSKTYKGNTTYFDIKIRDSDGKVKPLVVKGKDIIIISDLPDPNNKSDTRNEYNTQIESDIVSSGSYGKMLLKLNEVWMDKMTKLINDPKIVIFPLINSHYSESCPIVEKRGKPFTDASGTLNPRFRLPIDFTFYPENFYNPELKGKPKIEILDASKIVIGANGKPGFAHAAINGEPLKKENAHLLLKRGVKIIKTRIHIDSASKHKFGVSARQVPQTLIIMPNQGTVYEDSDNEEEMVKILLSKATIKDNEPDGNVKPGKQEMDQDSYDDTNAKAFIDASDQ